MHHSLLRIYHSSPQCVRSLAASGYGAYLRYSRYGPRLERLVEEALERDHWTPQHWEAWRQERLAYLLERAAKTVPYYREIWSKRRSRGDRASWQYLENWDLLEKEPLRQHPERFLVDGSRSARMFVERTSGTTGTPLTMWRGRDAQQAWYALVEARMRRWHGVSGRDRWAIFGGQLVVPVRSRKPPFWVWNAGMNQLYMSSYHLSPDHAAAYLDGLKKFKVVYLLGYTSALYFLAQQALRLGRRDLKMAVALTNAEPLADFQRQVISEAFQCPVRETYGSSEIVGAASECAHGTMHLWPEAGHLEIWSGTTMVQPGAPGELIWTGLLNADMPLIRYRIGDLAGPRTQNTASCSCGASLPVMPRIEGRADDVLLTMDHRRVGRLDPIFKADMPIQEAQIIQERLDHIRLRYVPGAGFTARSGDELVRAIRDYLGSVEVTLEPVDHISRGPNGKFRAVICNLPKQLGDPVTMQECQ